MPQGPMTFRPLDENNRDAPPPYEANATTTSPPISPIAPHQQYPVLSAATHHDGTTSLPSPPPISYYPPMTTISNAIPTVAAVASTAQYPQYPTMTMAVPDTSSEVPYPIASSDNFFPSPLVTLTVSNFYRPQLYPTIPLQDSTTNDGTYPISLSSTPSSLSVQYEPSAPSPHNPQWSLYSSTISTPATAASSLFQDDKRAMQNYYNELDSRVESTSITQHPYLSQASSQQQQQQQSPTYPSFPAMTPIPKLVTTFRCKKCGTILESETAVCKRIHTVPVNFSERKVQHATGRDLRERTIYDSDLFRMSSHNSMGEGRRRWSTAHENSHNDSYDAGNASADAMNSNGGDAMLHSSSSPQRSRATSYCYAPFSSTGPGPPELGLLAPPTITTTTTVTDNTQYETSNGQIRRSMSVQNPMTTLRKLWRDAKNEFNYQSSTSRSSWQQQYEIVAPSPLPSSSSFSPSTTTTTTTIATTPTTSTTLNVAPYQAESIYPPPQQP
ncbi:hypothetical protein BX616_002434 [Lobosporangium transversale]|uniref:Uncharacterized protein n=1 Tax=Lobosporangium transversale TaxID=64571 RepID=A0A1Y2GH24_9FUNG|nr:hypothetical protein BCR41DRAFT_357547 [Lobosporangium transversale]KAF9900951.1 hypothetical protein BX616_002434 [Lobosporangium transversale]ORZ10645.1 hypothetical protein BCR41DRAFT_357547 [Lobosporangium transversale]|eukprot:XP_021879366.1 hypothetical protein BCR41DRAFT_357547 [Lobosporangium transversale]